MNFCRLLSLPHPHRAMKRLSLTWPTPSNSWKPPMQRLYRKPFLWQSPVAFLRRSPPLRASTAGSVPTVVYTVFATPLKTSVSTRRDVEITARASGSVRAALADAVHFPPGMWVSVFDGKLHGPFGSKQAAWACIARNARLFPIQALTWCIGATEPPVGIVDAQVSVPLSSAVQAAVTGGGVEIRQDAS